MLNKKKTKFKRLVIFSIAFMFIFTAIQLSTVSINTTADNISIKPISSFQKIKNFQPQKININYNSESSQTKGLLGTDTLIYGGDGESIVENPTITDNGGQNIVIGFDLSPDWLSPVNPYFRYSNDGGITWLPENGATGWLLSDNDYTCILPAIDFAGDNGAFGSVLPYDQNNWVTFNFPDISNPDSVDNEWVANSWLADVMMSEWHSVDACGVNSEYAPSETASGIAIWTGNTINNIHNGLWFGWETSDGTASTFVVYPDEGVTKYDFEADQAVNDIDLTTGMYYQAFYRFNDESSEQYPDGVFLRGVQLDGTDAWVNSWDTLVHIPGASHPNIKATNGNCYLVYEINGGIGCYYSNDNGVTFDNVNIADNGKYPSVSLIGENIIVTYTKTANIYSSTSNDKGKTWIESSVTANDVSQSATERTHCVDVSSNYITWTDTRNGQNSVYFDTAGISAPIITIESIAGGLGITTAIKNIGSADANNIDWSISFDGGTFFGGDNSGTISILAVGDTVEIKSKFLMGLGKTEITINVGETIETKSAKLLLFFVVGL
ncbi:Uncharacterised protein [uncultured archaeon]|nr:Uncharacterised protein [uncultured archaeon]